MHPHDTRAIPGLHRKEQPISRWWLVLAALGVVVVVLLGVLNTLNVGEVEDKAEQLPVAEAQRDAAAGQAQAFAEQVVAACVASGQAAAELQRIGLCTQAAEVRAEPIPGPAGDPGQPGAAGATGPQGSIGAQGPVGPQGPPGPPGPPGSQGPQGLAGANGVPGVDGTPGVDGEPGRDGEQGPSGPEGDQGEQGPQGPAGEPAPPPALYRMELEGVRYTCVREGGADSAPVYSCAAETTPPTTTAPTMPPDEGGGS